MRRLAGLLAIVLVAWASDLAAGDRPPALKRTFLNPPPNDPSPALQQRGHSYRQGLQSDVRRQEFKLIKRPSLTPEERNLGAHPARTQSLRRDLRETRRERDRVNRALRARPRLAPAVGNLSASGRPPLAR